MSSDHPRTPERALILGSTAFSGIDSVTWQDQAIPNIPDYDLVIVSVPHITEDFLAVVNVDYLDGLRKAFVRFLHSGGKLLVLVSPTLVIQRPSKYPERVSNTTWCPVTYVTHQEAGRSIVTRQPAYAGYLGKMSEWSFYLAIPPGCLTKELTAFYGATYRTRYGISLEPYLTNRYERVLAGYFNVEGRAGQVLPFAFSLPDQPWARRKNLICRLVSVA